MAGIAAGLILGQIPVPSTTPVRALATLTLLAILLGSVFHVFAKLLDGTAHYGKTLVAVLDALCVIFLLCSALALVGRLLSVAISAIPEGAVNVIFYYPLAAYLLAIHAALRVWNVHRLTFPQAAVFLILALGLAGYGLYWPTINLQPWGIQPKNPLEARQVSQVCEKPCFEGVGGVQISYAVYPATGGPTAEKGVVVVSSGRTENRDLYRETIDTLQHAGYTVYIHDHRGQGYSGRLVPGEENRQRSHVGLFDDYVTDLETFVHEVQKAKASSKLYLLAHSMGGGVAALYLEKHPDIFTAAALVTPMNGAQIPLQPVLCRLNELVPDEALDFYALGKGDFDSNKKFAQDDLTHSFMRHESKSTLYAQKPQLAIGDVTHGWLRAACEAGPRTVAGAKKIEDPILLFQASHDTAVDNEAQEKFAAGAKGHVYGYVVPQAYHAILMEDDMYRRPVMDMIVGFFDRDGAAPAAWAVPPPSPSVPLLPFDRPPLTTARETRPAGSPRAAAAALSRCSESIRRNSTARTLREAVRGRESRPRQST